ncbi:MAG: hypothetical protein HPZ84_00505 [Desulfovibrionaceae bacterium]|nr:hypothetical protein [Desulfovibrionaceae bacterium]
MMDLTKRVQESLVGYANKGNEKVLGAHSSFRIARKELLFSELPRAFLKHVMAHSLLKLCKFIIPNILPKQTAKNISPDYKEIFQILCCNGRQNKENSKDQ